MPAYPLVGVGLPIGGPYAGPDAVTRAAGGTGPIVFRAGPVLADAEHRTPPTAWTEPSVLDDLARAADQGISQVDGDLNIVETPIPDQLRALERLADKIY